MDAHRPDAVASRREHAAGETNEVSDGHRPAVAARSYRSRDLPAPEHPRLALATTGRRERPEAVLRDCAGDHVYMRRVLWELREAILEQVGTDQTDRLSRALSDALNALSRDSINVS